METSLPETSFVLESGRADFRVRYLTPRGEIPFAGHPTITTAFLLARIGIPAICRFGCSPGRTAAVHRHGRPGELAPALWLKESDFLASAPWQVVSTGGPFLIVPLKTLEAVKTAEMDRPRARPALRGMGGPAMFVCLPQGYTSAGNTFARLLDPDDPGEDS